MKIVTFFALFLVIYVISDGKKESGGNTFDVTGKSIEFGYRLVKSFHQKDSLTMKQITATESNSGNHYAFEPKHSSKIPQL